MGDAAVNPANKVGFSNPAGGQQANSTPEMQALRDKLREERGEAEQAYIAAHKWFMRRRSKLVERMAFYRGWQHGRPRFGLFEQALIPDDRIAFEVFNYIRPTVRSAVQKKLKSWPNPSVSSPSGDPIGQLRAQATQRLARSLLRTGKIDFEEFYAACAASEIHGAAWVKVFWDPTITVRGQQLGDLRTEYCSVLDVFYDPTARSLAEVRYVIHRKVMPLSAARWQYPTTFFGDPTTNDQGGSLFVKHGILPEDGYTYTANDDGMPYAVEHMDKVEVVECWEKPSDQYPKGRFLSFSGPTLLGYGVDQQTGEPSLPHAWPWCPIRGINRVPGNVYADGAIADAIQINKSINAAASKMRESMNLMAAPAWLVPFESEVNRDNFDDIGGNVINYKALGGVKPEPLVHPGINPTVFQYTEAQKQTLSDVTAMSDIARGQAPPAGTSARSIGFQAELNDAVNAPDAALFQLDCLRIIKTALELIRDGYDEGRLVQLAGPANQLEAQLFKRDDYDFGADLVIDVLSQEPTSRAVRMSEATELFQMGAFEDTPGAVRFRKKMAIDADDTQNVQDIYQLHFQRAQKETAMFLQAGQPPQRGPVDNDDAHLDHMETFMISDAFVNMDPMMQQAYIQHYQEHQMARQAAFMNFQAQGGGPAGTSQGPGGSPTGTPPAGKQDARGPGIESPSDGGHSPFPAPPGVST